MVKIANSIVWILLMMWSGQSLAAVTVQVDRFNISEHETVNLTIKVSGDDSGEPEMDKLQQDFDLLSRNQSTSYSLINGSMSHKASWNIILRPKRVGALTIPAMSIGSATTQSITIQVSKEKVRDASNGEPQGDIWLDMQIEPEQVLVQQQAIITIRIYQAVALNQAQISEPAPAHAIVERLGEDSTFQLTKNNRRWHVTERRYALFPQQSGSLEIEALQLDGSVLVGNGGYFQSAKPVRVRSNALSLDVRAKPDSWVAAEWLPAKGIRLEESWPESTEYKVGEPITRTLTVYADGLTSSQLPVFFSALPDHLKAYPDTPVLSDDKQRGGIIGSRQEKTAIMPTRPGTYILPELNLSWWNTETGKAEGVSIPARTFKVIADASVSQSTPPAAPERLQVADVKSTSTIDQDHQTWWLWLAIISTTGWILTLIWIWFSRRKLIKKPQLEKTDLSAANRALERACQHNDAKACEQLLLQISRLQLPDAAPHSLSVLALLCDESLGREVLALEQALYADVISAWRGESLLSAFQRGGFRIKQDQQVDATTALPALYPK